MNVLKLLNEELKNEWELEEKIRYLYIRSCELFSYDPRYKFMGLFDDWKNLESNIRYREIDLENVQDNLVICSSHAREVYSKLLREILNIKPVPRGNGHSWVEFRDGKRDMVADATESSDLARVKMKLSTYGYKPEKREFGYSDRLKEIDIKIGYINSEYENDLLQRQKSEIEQEFNIEQNYINKLDEYIIYNLYTIKEIFEKYNSFSSFSDAEFCISYLIRIFLEKCIRLNRDILNLIPLFQINDNGKWTFKNIYAIKLENDTIYFILEQNNNEFNFYEITEIEAINYTKKFKSCNKQMILRK